jgi:hypothetical protein
VNPPGDHWQWDSDTLRWLWEPGNGTRYWVVIDANQYDEVWWDLTVVRKGVRLVTRHVSPALARDAAEARHRERQTETQQATS